MTYPTTFPIDAADSGVKDLKGWPCPRLTGPREVARRLAELDERYIRDNFVPLDDLADARPGTDSAAVREHIGIGRLPEPAYRLDDGTDMVPSDYFALVDEAGSVQGLREWFAAEYAHAAGELGQRSDEAAVHEQWGEYICGGYFVCLRSVTPAAIAAKGHWIDTIEALLADPRPAADDWLGALRESVEGLAAIERRGAILDPARWGGPMSPQWYGEYLRTRYPQAF